MPRNTRAAFAALIFAALIAALFVTGRGSSPPPSPGGQPVTAPFVCHTKVPAQAGECIEQEEKAKGFELIAPLTSSAPSQGVDISNWQGIPDLRASGVKFVLIQTNDGTFHNPFLSAQVAAARRAGIPFGFYTFVEAFSGSEQASIALSLGQRYAPQLGYWADVEKTGAYEHACAYVSRIKQAGLKIAGVYSSPGLYFAGRCAGYIWPAEWGSGRAYPLNGYPSSAIKVRQWCGTCSLAGFSGQVDRDESLGLLSLITPPKPKRTLDEAYHLRRVLRADLTRHHCRQPPWHVAVGLSGKPNGHYEHSCHVWLAEGAAVNKDIRAKGGK
jgi:GH25 family lysozyme M1 (1,4-beta-N-acetylmuramidase)